MLFNVAGFPRTEVFSECHRCVLNDLTFYQDLGEMGPTDSAAFCKGHGIWQCVSYTDPFQALCYLFCT